MQQLHLLLMNQHFIKFLNNFCQKTPTCDNLPPFYYTSYYLNNVPSAKTELIDLLDQPRHTFLKHDLQTLKTQNNPLYLLKTYFLLFPPSWTKFDFYSTSHHHLTTPTLWTHTQDAYLPEQPHLLEQHFLEPITTIPIENNA